jgi:hypothetical protein
VLMVLQKIVGEVTPTVEGSGTRGEAHDTRVPGWGSPLPGQDDLDRPEDGRTGTVGRTEPAFLSSPDSPPYPAREW